MSTESAIIPRTPVPVSSQTVNFITPFSVFDRHPKTRTFIDMGSKVLEDTKVPEVGWLSCTVLLLLTISPGLSGRS